MASPIPFPVFKLFNKFYKKLSQEEIENMVNDCHIVLEESIIGIQTLGKLLHTASHSNETDIAEIEMLGHLIRNMGEQSQDLLMVIQLAEKARKRE